MGAWDVEDKLGNKFTFEGDVEPTDEDIDNYVQEYKSSGERQAKEVQSEGQPKKKRSLWESATTPISKLITGKSLSERGQFLDRTHELIQKGVDKDLAEDRDISGAATNPAYLFQMGLPGATADALIRMADVSPLDVGLIAGLGVLGKIPVKGTTLGELASTSFGKNFLSRAKNTTKLGKATAKVKQTMKAATPEELATIRGEGVKPKFKQEYPEGVYPKSKNNSYEKDWAYQQMSPAEKAVVQERVTKDAIASVRKDYLRSLEYRKTGEKFNSVFGGEGKIIHVNKRVGDVFNVTIKSGNKIELKNVSLTKKQMVKLFDEANKMDTLNKAGKWVSPKQKYNKFGKKTTNAEGIPLKDKFKGTTKTNIEGIEILNKKTKQILPETEKITVPVGGIVNRKEVLPFKKGKILLKDKDNIRRTLSKTYRQETVDIVENIIANNPDFKTKIHISNKELNDLALSIHRMPVLERAFKEYGNNMEFMVPVEARRMMIDLDTMITNLGMSLKQDINSFRTEVSGALASDALNNVIQLHKMSGRLLQSMKHVTEGQIKAANMLHEYIKVVTKHPLITRELKHELVSGLMKLRELALKKDLNPTLWDKAFEAWVNSLLFSPFTHIKNVGSNLAFTLSKIPEKAVYSTIDAFYSMIAGKKIKGITQRTHRLGEIPHQIKGLYKALFTKEKLATGIAKGSKLESRLPLISGPKGKIIRASSRALIAEDNWNKSITGFMELHGRAYNMAKNEGLTGELLTDRINQLILNPIQSLITEVHMEQKVRAFQNATGLGNILNSLPQDYLRWLIPFRRTPAAIVTSGAKRSPLGIVGIGRKAFLATAKKVKYPQTEVVEDVGNTIIGTGLTAGLLYLFSKGRISGAPPRDKKERVLWDAQDKQPYSMTVGNLQIPIGKLEPYGNVVVGVIDFIQSYQEKGEAPTTERLGDAINRLASNLGEDAFGFGLMDAMSHLVGGGYGTKTPLNWTVKFAGSMIPMSGLLRSGARLFDPGVKDAKTVKDMILKNIPIFSNKVNNKINLFGEDVTKAVGGRISAFPITKTKEDYIVSELFRLDSVPSMPGRTMTENGLQYEMTEESHRRMLRTKGRMLYKTLHSLMSTTDYWRAPNYTMVMKDPQTGQPKEVMGKVEMVKLIVDGLGVGTRLITKAIDGNTFTLKNKKKVAKRLALREEDKKLFGSK